MIHHLLLRLDEALPLYPPAIVGLVAMLVIALAVWRLERSRETVLLCLAIALLGAGLTVGLVGLDKPGAAMDWGFFERLAGRSIGPAAHRQWEQWAAAGIVLAAGALALLYNLYTQERPGERSRRLLERDEAQSNALGSAQLCNPKTFRRWSEPDAWGWTLRGTFWGARGRKLGERLALGGEDIARGMAVFGPQGSGKTQAVILPAIADRMRSGHSLIVTDVQGELRPYVARVAALTGHVVVVHNPSDPGDSCALNLCDWVDAVADAQAMAAVLLSGARQQGHDSFWTRSATNLLAACALHYPSFGAVLDARHDLQRMARELKDSPAPGAAALAADFSSSMETREPRLAHNIMATAFNVGLAPWADPALRAITDHTSLPLAEQLVQAKTVLLLGCARRHADAYGPYLGTLLRVLTTRLDDLGQKAGGTLPGPVGLILEEFPALGRLDGLVRDVNLVRKRRISILTAAQSMAQFDHIYAAPGEADRLLAGLATKIVFGGCDRRTAGYFSELSGQQTLALTSVSRSWRPGQRGQDSSTASLRGRALLLPDDLVQPARGHATIFAAYGEGGRAAQAIFHAELTPFFRRRDWKLDQVQAQAPVAVAGPAQVSKPYAPKVQSPEPEAESQEAEKESDDQAESLNREIEVGL